MKYIVTISLLFCSYLSIGQNKTATPPAEQLAKEKAKAAKGDTAAMYRLGLYNYYGVAVKQNYPMAMQWLTKAATKGHPGSMLLLGEMYEEGEGTKKNLPLAFSWVKKAADKGSVEALNHVGEMYEEGIGTKENMTEAIKYYTKAAEKDYTEAMVSLAFHYIEGNGIKQEKGVGLAWLQRAAEKKEPLAMRYLGDYYGDPEMGNDCAQATQWYMKAADNGDTLSFRSVGEIFLEGTCAKSDVTKVAEWAQANCDKGIGDACYLLARFYVEGKGVGQSYGKAMDLFIKDAEMQIAKGDVQSNSMRNLFVLYNMEKLSTSRQNRLLDWLEATAKKTGDDYMASGIGFIYTNRENASNEDYRTALSWSMKAAEKGNATGAYNVGYLYANGFGVNLDYKVAFDWMMKAAKKGDKVAMETIAEFYEKGHGVPPDLAKAAEWKNKATQAQKGE
jgi:TPR repeat protein